MLRIMATASLLVSLTIIALPQGRNSRWLDGRWEGTGFQIDTGETWTMKLTRRGGKFLIEYPTLNCEGEWKLISVNSRTARFREKITSGRGDCVDKGNVIIERLNGRQIAFRYSYQGKGEISASAILNRQK